VVIAIGVGGLAASGVMTFQTVLMMVLPSMLVFAALAFWLGMKHGEFRATH
jgi:membrane protein DedA with SNARE-associated domain